MRQKKKRGKETGKRACIYGRTTTYKACFPTQKTQEMGPGPHKPLTKPNLQPKEPVNRFVADQVNRQKPRLIVTITGGTKLQKKKGEKGTGSPHQTVKSTGKQKLADTHETVMKRGVAKKPHHVGLEVHSYHVIHDE